LLVNPGGFLLDNTIVSFEKTSIAGTKAGHLQLVDSNLNHLLSGGDTVEAEALPLHKVEVKVRDNKNGTYDLIYPPDFRGKFDVSLKVNDKPAPGGPWSVEVSENPLEPGIKEALSTLLPKAQHVWARLLAQATPQERQLVLRELKAVALGKALTGADLADLVMDAEQPTETLF